MNSLRFFMLLFLSAACFAQAPPVASTPAPPSITVTGLITHPLVLTRDDLARLPRSKAHLREENGTEAEYEGVSLLQILDKAGAPSGKDLRGKAILDGVVARATDGYTVVFTLAEVDPQFAGEDVLVADTRNGAPMVSPLGPFRLVCPQDHAGARSLRMLIALDVAALVK